MSNLSVAMGALGCPIQETVTQYEICLTIMRNCHMRRSHGKSVSLLKVSNGFISRTMIKPTFPVRNAGDERSARGVSS